MPFTLGMVGNDLPFPSPGPDFPAESPAQFGDSPEGQGWQCWERVIIYPAAHLYSSHARCCSPFAYSIVEVGWGGGIGRWAGEPWPGLGALGCSVLPAAAGARGCQDIHIWSRFVDNGAPAPGCTWMSCDNLTACPGIPTEPFLSKAISAG